MHDRKWFITRRTLMGGLGCFTIGGGLAQAQLNPPALQTVRHQFVELMPQVALPTVRLSSVEGRAGNLAAVAGKVLLVNVWATWCGLCRTDLPGLDRLQDTASERVAVVAISVDRGAPSTVTAFLKQIGVKHLRVLLDPSGMVASSAVSNNAPLPIYGMPITYLVTPSGRIAGYIAGDVDWLSLDAQRLLDYYLAAG